MEKHLGFIEVSVLRDSAAPEAAEHRATIAVSHILDVRELARVHQDFMAGGGAWIFVNEASSHSEPWCMREEGIADQPACRRLLVKEVYGLVKWLLANARNQQGILSAKDFEELISPRLKHAIPAPKLLKIRPPSKKKSAR